MFDEAGIIPVPFEALNEDEMRTIAREYVEGHGTGEEPDMRDLVSHCVRVLARTRNAPVMADEDSMATIASLIRRAAVAVELPVDLMGPTQALDVDTTRAWARYIRDEWGPGLPPGLIRKVLAEEYAEEIAEGTVDSICELVNDARSMVQLPGDREYQEAVYPGRNDPRGRQA